MTEHCGRFPAQPFLNFPPPKPALTGRHALTAATNQPASAENERNQYSACLPAPIAAANRDVR
jgi:hypothetical protein